MGKIADTTIIVETINTIIGSLKTCLRQAFNLPTGGKTMKHGNHKTYQVFIYFPSGKSCADKRSYKTFEGAYKRLLALQESNNNEAMYGNGVLCDYLIA